MALIKNHQFVDDNWIFYEPELEPSNGIVGVIFNLQNFTACSHNIPPSLQLGLKLANHDPVSALSEHIGQLSLLILEFPGFADGRAYSQAQSITRHLGYEGELRATGNVLIDQYAFMLQCGFNSFEVPADTDLTQWKNAARIIPTTYSDTQGSKYSHIWNLRNAPGS